MNLVSKEKSCELREVPGVGLGSLASVSQEGPGVSREVGRGEGKGTHTGNVSSGPGT